MTGLPSNKKLAVARHHPNTNASVVIRQVNRRQLVVTSPDSFLALHVSRLSPRGSCEPNVRRLASWFVVTEQRLHISLRCPRSCGRSKRARQYQQYRLWHRRNSVKLRMSSASTCPSASAHLTALVAVADHGRRIVRKDSGHRRQVAHISVDDAK